MRIVTYNIHAGTDEGRNPSLETIAETLLGIEPDICLLQEVDRFLPRSGYRDQGAYLAKRLRAECRFYGRLKVFGNAVLSRVPVASVRCVPLPGPGEPRSALGIVLPGGLEVWNTHLGLSEEARALQLAALERALPAGPFVLGGDFNAALEDGTLRAFVERLELAPLSPPDPTFPVSAPTHRIDFLFGRGVSGTGATAAGAGSDHCPVWADVAPLPPPSPPAD